MVVARRIVGGVPTGTRTAVAVVLDGVIAARARAAVAVVIHARSSPRSSPRRSSPRSSSRLTGSVRTTTPFSRRMSVPSASSRMRTRRAHRAVLELEVDLDVPGALAEVDLELDTGGLLHLDTPATAGTASPG